MTDSSARARDWRPALDGLRLSDLSEEELLALIDEALGRAGAGEGPGRGRVAAGGAPAVASGAQVLVPSGDDAAVLSTPGGSVVATTDSMVRGLDWRDDWSTGHDVGRKLVTQNVADLAAMGARPSGLLIALAADAATDVRWVVDFAEGVAQRAGEVGAAVIGGDLSGAPPGAIVATMTALGDLQGRTPVCRSGAQVGDVVAVCGSLGLSGAGLSLYAGGSRRLPAAAVASTGQSQAGTQIGAGAQVRAQAGERATGSVANGPAVGDLTASDSAAGDSSVSDPAVQELLWAHATAGRPPHEAGVDAATAGAGAMIDISDGLVRDAGRIAAASGVSVDLDEQALRAGFLRGSLLAGVGPEVGWQQILSGGEEHSLLACFSARAWRRAAEGQAHPGRAWTRIGSVVPAVAGARVLLDGRPVPLSGWDHFGG